MKRKTLKHLALGCALLLPTLAAPAANADITRHCRGHYVLSFLGFGVYSPTPTFPIPDFSASGSCGSSVPNRCRTRARDRVNRCMQKHWDTRWQFVRPLECTPSHGVSGYMITDVKRMIEVAACCTLGSPIRNTSGTVIVSRVSYGDKGCGDGKISSTELPPSTANPAGSYDVHVATLSNYDVSCPAIRQRFCPAP